MSNAVDMPVAYAAEERAPHLEPAYCYVVQREDGTTMFLTGRDKPVWISALPAYMSAADPQEFLPTQVRHSSIEGKDRYEMSSTTLSVTTENTQFQRYFLTAAAIKLRAWILRAQRQSVSAEGDPFEYGVNAITVQSGILGKVGFKGQTIAVEITPEPFYSEGGVPRIYYQRECQHFLYGPQHLGVGCGVNKELFKFETTIAAINPAQRIITLTGQKPGAVATYFNRGHFENLTVGGKMAIAWSAFNGDDTDLKLAAWNPDLAVGQDVKAFKGCLHTVGACGEFNNKENFGGFPYVPNRTPLAGVA